MLAVCPVVLIATSLLAAPYTYNPNVPEECRIRDGLPNGSVVGGVHLLFSEPERADALDRSTIRYQRARERVQKCSLSAPVLSDDRHTGRGSDDEIDMVEHRGYASHYGDVGSGELRAMARRMTVGQGEHVNPSKQHAEHTEAQSAHNDGDPERGQNERPPRTRRYSTSVVGLLSRHRKYKCMHPL